MKNQEELELSICQRCKKNIISFYCSSCPKPFDKLCSDCDTYVHSIIPYKKYHQRSNLGNSFVNNNFLDNKNYKKEIEELEEKSTYQINIINKLIKENADLKNDMKKLIEQNNILLKEKEQYLKELNFFKNEMEKNQNKNNLLINELNKSNELIKKLNEKLNIMKNGLSEKEIEIEEMKNYYNNKITSTKGEKEYLLRALDNSNIKLIDNNKNYYQLKEENELFKKRLINFEQENVENLKLISQLHKENKELIHRINQLTNINN